MSEQIDSRIGGEVRGALDGATVSVFCGSLAMMLAAGIQLEEAVHLMDEGRENARIDLVSCELWRRIAAGQSLGDAMAATGVFPRFALDMVRAGERAGRVENVLRHLATYYDEESRIMAKIRVAVGYPAALLGVMTVIIAFTVWALLPIFADVYEQLAGGMTTGSFAALDISVGIGAVALAVTLALALATAAAFFASQTPGGVAALQRLLEHLPMSRAALYQLALARFTAALSTLVVAGSTTEDALADAARTVGHRTLRERLDRAHAAMSDLSRGLSLAQAIDECEIFDPLYARLLTVGSRSGALDTTLEDLASVFFDDAVDEVDHMIGQIEPALAALITVAVGATLVAVMLPLIGIMSSIG